MDTKAIEAVALSIRSLSMDAIQKANSGHPGLPLGAAEVAAVLYGELLKHNPADSKWVDRDRCRTRLDVALFNSSPFRI